ncbi:TerD family protein [Rathayibacter rathayi]|uniref:TerD family protein n=1 Tax=Rathayibacter rathayi TaxID=33887 RepID=UPI000CE80F19|nr:TerD family protein [Rathayibacter rathayi]PPG14401.1 chemical-damaging agent resistance protein C [Rathayibacter rathayi]
MTFTLDKGDSLSLDKAAPGLEHVLIGLGWKPRRTSGEKFDLDVSALLVTSAGTVRSNADYIFYNQKNHLSGALSHSGDNRTGEGDGDDETLNLETGLIQADIDRIIIVVSIDKALERGQRLGLVDDAYVRIVNTATDEEVIRYDLREELGAESVAIFAEIFRENGGWSFRAIGRGHAAGLKALTQEHGVNWG